MGKSSYRPDIDGLRAIAVLSVIAFHFRPRWFPGGFVGVDIFFVISGYLITRILIEDIAATGRVSLPAFYSRRIRRIVPALFVVLLASLAAGFFFLMPGDYETMAESAIYSAFGGGNLFFLWNTNYFDREAALQPLLHLWSLGVEEQFYLAWPLLLAAAAWLTGRRRAMLAVFVAIAIVLSFATAQYVLSVDPKGAFYLPHTRAWELAAGALLIFLPAISNRIAAEIVGVAGLALIAWSLVVLDVTDPFPGWTALLPVIGAMLLIWPRKESITGRALAIPPMRFVGLISYSLYLWHWPALVFFRVYANVDSPTRWNAIPLLLAIGVLAVLSWRFVELPVRRLKRPVFKVFVAGAAAMTAAASIATLVIMADGLSWRLSRDQQAMRSFDLMWSWDCPQSVDIPGIGPRQCAFGAPWSSAASKGLLIGDSHAAHMAPIFEAAIGNRDISFVVTSGCPAALGGVVRRVWSEQPDYVEKCTEERRKLLATLRARSDIGIVALAASWFNLTRVVSQDGSLPADTSANDLVVFGVGEFLQSAAADGRTFILVNQVPLPERDPTSCSLIEDAWVLRRDCPDVGRQIWRNVEGRERPLEKLFTALAAARTDTLVVSPSEGLCKGGECLLSLNGEALFADGNHIRRNLSLQTRRDLASRIGLISAITDAARRGGSTSAGRLK